MGWEALTADWLRWRCQARTPRLIVLSPTLTPHYRFHRCIPRPRALVAARGVAPTRSTDGETARARLPGGKTTCDLGCTAVLPGLGAGSATRAQGAISAQRHSQIGVMSGSRVTTQRFLAGTLRSVVCFLALLTLHCRCLLLFCAEPHLTTSPCLTARFLSVLHCWSCPSQLNGASLSRTTTS